MKNFIKFVIVSSLCTCLSYIGYCIYKQMSSDEPAFDNESDDVKSSEDLFF